jgi:hypothetical protein
MFITVYNDNIKVFEGTLSDFLSDNDNDEWLTDECRKLASVNQIEFNEISGHWKIVKTANNKRSE